MTRQQVWNGSKRAPPLPMFTTSGANFAVTRRMHSSSIFTSCRTKVWMLASSAKTVSWWMLNRATFVLWGSVSVTFCDRFREFNESILRPVSNPESLRAANNASCACNFFLSEQTCIEAHSSLWAKSCSGPIKVHSKWTEKKRKGRGTEGHLSGPDSAHLRHVWQRRNASAALCTQAFLNAHFKEQFQLENINRWKADRPLGVSSP